MSEELDVVIVGGGPSALAAALYTGRANMDTKILERQILGGQIVEAYDVDNYPGFPEGVTGPDLVEQMQAHAEKFGAEIEYEEVKDITLDGSMKRVITEKNEYVAPIVILASGADHRKLGVPGEKELSGKGVSYCATCDGAFFVDKKLVVVGGGDAATTESLFLTRFASEIKLVHRRQGFRARAIHKENAQNHEKIEFILDTIVTEIHGDEKVEGVTLKNVQTEETRYLECDGVFILIGANPNTEYLQSIMPKYAGTVIPVDFNMETEVKGVYAVGDVRKGSYRQVGTGIGEAITAAMHSEERIKSLMEE